MDRNAWDRQENEPTLWYARFDAGRLMGTGRTIEAIYQAEIEADRSKSKRKKRARRPSSQWYKMAQQYHWRERWEAWDQAERERLDAEAEAALLLARRKLAAAAPNAVDALARQLQHKVAGVRKNAADDILDRVGLQSAAQVDVDVTSGGKALDEPRLSDAERALALASLIERLRGDAGRRDPPGDDQPGS